MKAIGDTRMAKIKNYVRKILFSSMKPEDIDNFYKLYYKLRYPKEMQQKCSFGVMNSDKEFYVIRPRTDGTEGLMSLFINVAKNLYYAKDNGYTPVVDFENYHTQYQDIVDGNSNAWEFFFTQPSNYKLGEVYKSKNVILSGLEIQWYDSLLNDKNRYNSNVLADVHDFLFKQIDFNEKVKSCANQEIENLQLNCSNTLGLYLRGTDYTALKPSGHPIQPSVEQAMVIVDEFLEKYNLERIFLVTEDGKIYNKIKEKYGEKCAITTYDSFVDNYDGKNFLSHDKCINELDDSPYKRGLNYLAKLLILSKCDYFVGGDTMGSWATMIFAGDKYKDKYVFNLGTYGK